MLPCDNCFLLPLCRNKGYEKLLADCEFITKLLYREYRLRNITAGRTFEFVPYIVEIQDTLKPSQWRLVEHDEIGYLIEAVHNEKFENPM